MTTNPKFIKIVSFGIPTYINVQCIESVLFMDGKTRICPQGDNGYFETDEPLEEIMRRIQEES